LRLPRDVSGRELVPLLRHYGYEQTRQVGSHIRIQSELRGQAHRVTIPDHSDLRLGTLNGILSDVADYLGRERSEFARELFERK
jgi:predicted RNA binding protein YcfA (HicA-like mRNA interferase family)